MDKLHISNEMKQFDLKNRNFYDELTDEEKKKFSNYLMIRGGSCVEGSQELQEFYLIATNERLNKHFFTVNRFPKLQWLLATSVSPGLGQHRHNWIAAKRNETKTRKLLGKLYPLYKNDDLDVLAKMVSAKDVEKELKKYESNN